MKRMTSIGLIIVMLFVLTPQQMSFAKDTQSASAANISLATLENIYGGVFVKKAGGIKEFKGINGMDIAQGDSVRTDQEGSANIIFRTGSKMTVGENTLFTVDKLQETKTSGLKVSIKLKDGTLWNNVKSLVTEEEEYEIVTASSSVQVRGTMILAEVDSVIGQSTTSVVEGRALLNAIYMAYFSRPADPAALAHWPEKAVPGSSGQGSLLTMGQSRITFPPPINLNSSPEPPPPPSSIGMNSLAQNQSPNILANMAVDMIDRVKDLTNRAQLLLDGYQNNNEPAFIRGALQHSQNASQLADLSNQFMNALQTSMKENQRSQLDRIFQQQQQTNLDASSQVMQDLINQVRGVIDNATEQAQQAGIGDKEIQRIKQNAPTSQLVPAPTGGEPSSPPPSSHVPAPGANTGPQPSPIPGTNPDPQPSLPPSVGINDLEITSVSGSSITLEWSKALDLDIQIQTSSDGLNWSNFNGNHILAESGRAFTINDLSPNMRYYFRLLIVNGTTNSHSNSVVITTDRTQLTGISDITGTARVGETLSAGMVTPEIATVTYQWQIASSADGTYEDIEGQIGNQYIIGADAVSKCVRVVSTGTGNYAGTVISNPTDVIGEALPTPISWLSPMPSVSFSTDGNAPQIIVEYKANQGGEVYYIITPDYYVPEDDKELIDLITTPVEGEDFILLSGDEGYSSGSLESIEIPYSEVLYANMSYNLYMVLKGANETYSEVKSIAFSTPKDVKPPILTASVAINEDLNGLTIHHLVEDFDEYYDLYVWITPKDSAPSVGPTAQEVKDWGQAAQNEQRTGRQNEMVVDSSNIQPVTEYIIYLVVQDYSDAWENAEGLFSEVKQCSFIAAN